MKKSVGTTIGDGRVFGIGWAKTGTTTLGRCLTILGFDHQGQDLGLVRDIAAGDLSRIMNLAREKESFEDWPWIVLYEELDREFPGSRFILTRRDPGKWIRSYRNMLSGQRRVSPEMNEIRRILYGLPFPDVLEESLLARYERHEREVLEYFSDRPRDLLVVDWENGDGWMELCGFLGREIPEQEFPHSNRGNYETRKRGGRLKRFLGKWLRRD